MKEKTAVLDHVLAFGMALTLVAPLAARQAADATGSDDPAKPEVQAFELVLIGAVNNGGKQFAQEASKIWPTIEWEPGAPPIVTGVVVRGIGVYMFEVQVPGLNQTSIQYTRLMNQLPRPRPRPEGAQPVSNTNGDRVNATSGPVQADPMTVSPADAANFDLSREYSDGVRAELINALLDRSGLLPVGPSDSIVIVAGEDDSAVPLLYRTSHKLVLTIKGSDLAAFRAGTITRDDAKQRIKEEHF